eukprot:425832-Ditylum_brightwellii.AAC.1
MVTKSDIDYKNNYFEYLELTLIHSKPMTSTLLNLQNEIRSNAQSVDTTLGRGSNRHLGLVCNTTTHASIPGTAAHIQPGNPGPLVADRTAVQSAHASDLHQEEFHLFREVTNVEHALIQQIVKSIEPKYFSAIHNLVTNKISRTIPAIIEYSLDAYRDISPLQLQDLCNQVESYVFNPHEPIDTIYTEIINKWI